MPSNKSSSSPLIKRYLPVRLTLPGLDGKGTNDTFLYVTEHRGAAQEESSSKNSSSATLFVANAPFIPDVDSKLLLRFLFGQYGHVVRVTLMENTRSLETSSLQVLLPDPSFFKSIQSQGKFAHVVYESKNDMKKALKCLRKVMTSHDNDELPGLTLQKTDIEALELETERQLRNKVDKDDDVEEDSHDHTHLSGIAAVAERWRRSHQALSRSALLEECNAVMEAFEDAEDAERRRQASSDEPDDDGFVTVSYNNTSQQSNDKKRELGETTVDVGRRRAAKRSRKKKEGIGAKELPDFYRFQMKQSRMKNLQDLRKRFEEDLAKVKKIQESRQYKPFS